jgi:hypothetical protein
MTKGGIFFQKGEYSFRGQDFYLLPICFLMSSFSVVDAKGGEVLGTKAMKNISNTKHHPI